MNILFIGDIVGKPGRKMVKNLLPELKRKYNIDDFINKCKKIAANL